MDMFGLCSIWVVGRRTLARINGFRHEIILRRFLQIAHPPTIGPADIVHSRDIRSTLHSKPFGAQQVTVFGRIPHSLVVLRWELLVGDFLGKERNGPEAQTKFDVLRSTAHLSFYFHLHHRFLIVHRVFNLSHLTFKIV